MLLMIWAASVGFFCGGGGALVLGLLPADRLRRRLAPTVHILVAETVAAALRLGITNPDEIGEAAARAVDPEWRGGKNR